MLPLTGTAARRLRDAPVVWCATVRPDGSPHVTPVWFVVAEAPSGLTWWIATAARNVKVANVRRRPAVSLVLPDPEPPLVAEGPARVRDDFPRAVVEAFAAKYDGWDATSGEPDGPRVLIEVTTERWLFAG